MKRSAPRRGAAEGGLHLPPPASSSPFILFVCVCFLNVKTEDSRPSVHPVSPRLVHWWSAAGRMKFNLKKTLFNLMWAQSSETFMLRDVQSLFVVYKTSQMSRWSDFTFLSSWFLLVLHLLFPPS